MIQNSRGTDAIQTNSHYPPGNNHIWVFPKIGVPQNGWFIMKNPIKMDDLGVPLFLETPISHHEKQTMGSKKC